MAKGRVVRSSLLGIANGVTREVAKAVNRSDSVAV